ncbi:MAG TPA: ABC transporter ATP-binding protein [Thermoleophilaceae bacterium]|nr:ABC transporter ATP-binding protein [Thermoleophilaceae bacterium]
MQATAELHGVTRRFGQLTALKELSLVVEPGEVVALVGPSGCGKSTLLELLAGLQEPDAGSVEAEPAAYMPQRDLLLPWRNALDNAGLALECAGVRKADARREAKPLFARFGLNGFERARPHELSGGMRQRVALARTFLSGRPLLLLDEPFASLDQITRGSLQEWLAGALREEPRTVALVTHDVQEALYLADRVVIMSSRPGRLVAEIEVPMARPRARRAMITSREFAALEERALESLETG